MLARRPLTSKRMPDRRVNSPVVTGSGLVSPSFMAVIRELMRENWDAWKVAVLLIIAVADESLGNFANAIGV